MIHTTGIHHVTAIASDPQENLDFYTEVLGLRLVKQTVNFDDKYTYHLYYGDAVGTPGTILTFFPFENGRAGQVGRGQATATAFVIPDDSVAYWIERLESNDVAVGSPQTRFDDTVISFTDHDGQPIELVTSTTSIEPWTDGPVPTEHAIRGFHGVTITSLNPERTGDILRTLGYEPVGQETDRSRYRVSGEQAVTLDLQDDLDAPLGQHGVGTVHHVAFRAPDESTQLAWRDQLVDSGLRVTAQKDRQYFKSIYFREPGGVLFEIATDGPGFTRDESTAELGTELMLPPWLSSERDSIEDRLPDIKNPAPREH